MRKTRIKRKRASAVKWTTNSLPAEQMLEILKVYYQKTYAEDHGIEIKFGEIDAKNNRVNYSFKVQDIKHQGYIIAKDCPSASTGLIFQEANEDHSKNKNAFESIEKSFACN